MFINFNRIPGNHQLFLDYLYNFENVSRFYKSDFRKKENYNEIFELVSSSPHPYRNKISRILKEEYSALNPSDKTFKNINSLESANTLAVVTGQQLGILGGPLYTFYKIITAIKLADELNDRYDGYNFVPVFWLEGDDNDFNEVRWIKVIDDNNEIREIAYGDPAQEEDPKQSVGFVKFDERITDFFNEVKNALRQTEFTETVLARLQDFYSNGKSFKDAFKELIFWLFDSYGLIIFDPQNPEIKKCLTPVFTKEILDFRRHTEALVSVSANLDDSYHAQVKVKPVNLFYNFDNARFSIEPVENEFRLKRKRKSFSQNELLKLIEETPEAFSPNVLLRPICQDFLLPTAFYIAGPAEISYFAQVTPLYEMFNLVPPVIYPRASVTLLEKAIQKTIDKYNLNFTDLFKDPDVLKTRVLNSLTTNSPDDVFKDAANEIELAFDHLKEKLFEIDQTIADASSKYRQKALSYLDELKAKADESRKKKHEITLRQLDKVSVSTYPNSNLQERELNFFYFANKYDIELLKRFFNEIEINKFEHQVIEL